MSEISCQDQALYVFFARTNRWSCGVCIDFCTDMTCKDRRLLVLAKTCKSPTQGNGPGEMTPNPMIDRVLCLPSESTVPLDPDS